MTETHPYLDAHQLRKRVVFALAHIYRLQAEGLFPLPYHFSHARRMWCTNDITAWMQKHLDARKPSSWNDAGHPTLANDDIFICRRSLKKLVPYTIDHLAKLENDGLFPRRISIGPKRVVWLEREVLQWLESKKPPTAPKFDQQVPLSPL